MDLHVVRFTNIDKNFYKYVCCIVCVYCNISVMIVLFVFSNVMLWWASESANHSLNVLLCDLTISGHFLKASFHNYWAIFVLTC